MGLYHWEPKLWLLVDIQLTAGKPFQSYQSVFISSRDAETEVWTMANGENKTITPLLPHMHYTYGIALYVVDFNFCRK